MLTVTLSLFLGNENSARGFSDRSFFEPPRGHGRPRLRVMDVRTKVLGFPGFQGPDRSFCPRTSAGYPGPKLTWAAANGGVTNGGLRGVWPPFLEIGRNRPFSPFFCLFRPFPEGAKSTWEIQKTEAKGLFPQISSDLLKPPSAAPQKLTLWAAFSFLTFVDGSSVSGSSGRRSFMYIRNFPEEPQSHFDLGDPHPHTPLTPTRL